MLATTHKRQQKNCEVSGWGLVTSPPQWGAFAVAGESQAGTGCPPWLYPVALPSCHPPQLHCHCGWRWPSLTWRSLTSPRWDWPCHLASLAWSFRLLYYLSFWHFSSRIPELLRVLCVQSHHCLFLWLPHHQDHCLPPSLSSPSPGYAAELNESWALSPWCTGSYPRHRGVYSRAYRGRKGYDWV